MRASVAKMFPVTSSPSTTLGTGVVKRSPLTSSPSTTLGTGVAKRSTLTSSPSTTLGTGVAKRSPLTSSPSTTLGTGVAKRSREAARAVALLGTVAFAFKPAAAAPCEDLINLALPQTTITAAMSITSGQFDPPPPAAPITGLPPFCRVAGVASPTSTSMIGFEIWMPSETWNGKLQGVGSGGSQGSIGYTSIAAGLVRNYATMANDNGHTGGSWTFAQDPEKVIDFGYRAQHVSTQVAKMIVQAFYGSPAQHSYFIGCSQGGHHALMEAQRFPDDYDGIIGGDPANFWTHLMVAELFYSLEATLRDPANAIPAEKLPVITAAAVAECDAKDGLVDGLIGDARRCTFDPASLLCPSGDEPTCLTAPQVEAVKRIYAGPRNPRTGELIFPGVPPGSEAVSWLGLWVGVTAPGGSSNEFFTNGVYGGDPSFDYHRFDFDADVAFTDNKPAAGETYASALNAIDPDLTTFKGRGGKLLMYHGFSDGFITPLNSINYYQSVVAAEGGDLQRTQEFARLFMVPGMGHCAGGPGPTTFDPLSALEQWVEQGVAPATIPASHRNPDGSVTFTRPLCPYPQEARYRGHGSIDDAANFACRHVAVTPLPLADNFGGDSIDASLWSVNASEGTAVEGGGALTLSPNPNTGMSAILVTSNALYDLTGSEASVQVNQVVGLGNVNNQLSILLDWDNLASWSYENGFLYAVYYVAGVPAPVAALQYSAGAHGWWRIREYNGTVFWETSSDGASWIIQGAAATSRLFPLRAINVMLSAATFSSGSPDPGQARYSNLNIR